MDLGLLRDAFTRALPEAQQVEARGITDLGLQLSALLREARAAWSPVVVGDVEVLAHVAGYVRTDCPLPQAIAELRFSDLYGACACARGDNTAIRLFEQRYFGELDALWPSFRERVSHEDARQMLRQKLFAKSEDGGPKILKFAGRGDVRGWVRVVAARMLSDVVEKVQRERPVDEAFFDKLGAGVDIELDRFKAQYGAEFKEAFRLAVESLTPRERSVLRHAYVRDATVVEIGAVYGVHGATAARWVASARQRLVVALRKSLATRLHVTNAELESVLRLIESTVNVTLERYFREVQDAH
ncbi:putative DNA-binding regulatory protein [Labilithrix luteola]|uniref:Putative DNA-binding regulatory protein n=1 Tax=Labilithrix luteola TaxID=1391654 RepID=A0A0K1PSY4_9BACT|nr:sigma factor-like helix-turn-helix DNA-binding protein [Labilithrix luteola]AKU96219.1 putative DNA-binding regulatory protein [Labilithrix luteola]